MCHKIIVASVLLVGFIATTVSASRVPYQYTLLAEHHLLAGRIYRDADKGDKIKADVEMEPGHEEELVYLQIYWTENAVPVKSPLTTHRTIYLTTEKPTDSRGTSIGAGTHQSDSPGIPSHTLPLEGSSLDPAHTSGRSGAGLPTVDPHAQFSPVTGAEDDSGTSDFTGSGLPEDDHFQGPALRRRKRLVSQPHFVIAETNAFRINKDNYVVVNDTSDFEEHEFIEFYLYIADEKGAVVSNPLPFIVYIENPPDDGSYPTLPAVFAGVLVLFVVFLALFIPLVTRAKRRYKQGKPMFKLGSHPSSADLEQHTITRKASEPNWYGNNAFYNYEEEVEKEKSDFSKGLRQYSTKSEPVRRKEPLSEKSSSSGVDVSSQYGAEGTPEDCVQRL